MIAASIAFHARRTPQKLAIVDPHGRELSYLVVNRTVWNLVSELDRAVPGLRERHLVAVSFYDRRWQLLLMVALEAIGVPFVAFENLSDASLRSTLAYCDLALASQILPGFAGQQFVIGQDLIDRVEGSHSAEIEPFRIGPEAITMVLTTSGSTGAAKCVPLTRAAVEARDHNRIWQYGLSSASHLLVALPVGVTGMLFTWRGALRCGAALDFSQKRHPLQALARTTHTILLPLHVRQLLGMVPPEYCASHRLKLFVLGARLSKPLKAAAIERLGAEVYSVYGSNEAGACAWINDDDSVTVLAGVTTEVIAPNGEVLGQGSTGQLRIKAQEMAHRYLDAALSAERFVDGWFLTGDLAEVTGEGQWRLLGRSDTMLNLGGIKHSSEDIEDRLAARGLARDLAVAALADDDGIEELYIALEGALHSDQALIEMVGETLGWTMGNVRIVHLSQIPRAGQGKLQRAELTQMIRDAAARHG
jgi:acyl-coenzyme A synthetase/AMP-(fatty) acid ligase